MNDIPGLSRPLADAGKHVDSWDDAGGQLVVVASSTVSRSTCPQCAGQSRQVHGRYRRRLAAIKARAPNLPVLILSGLVEAAFDE